MYVFFPEYCHLAISNAVVQIHIKCIMETYSVSIQLFIFICTYQTFISGSKLY